MCLISIFCFRLIVICRLPRCCCCGEMILLVVSCGVLILFFGMSGFPVFWLLCYCCCLCSGWCRFCKLPPIPWLHPAPPDFPPNGAIWFELLLIIGFRLNTGGRAWGIGRTGAGAPAYQASGRADVRRGQTGGRMGERTNGQPNEGRCELLVS